MPEKLPPAKAKRKLDYWAALDFIKMEIDRAEWLQVVQFEKEKEEIKAHLRRVPELAGRELLSRRMPKNET